MSQGTPESDWTVFRELRETALERFCERALREAKRVTVECPESYHESYLSLYRLLQEHDRELARIFDDPRRSRMILQLSAIHRHELLEPAEFARFSRKTRDSVEGICGIER